MEIEKDQQKKCGIYCFEVVSGNPKKIGWKYIGQSLNIGNRKSSHLHKLRKDRHFSKKLQNYYNKYGENSLKFIILHECLKNELNFYEIFWISCFDSIDNGFNAGRGGYDNNHPWKKQCTLKNYITGEIDTCESVEEFARKHNLSSDAIRTVLSGKNKRTKDWYYMENKHSWHPKKYKVISPENIEYEFWETDIKSFAKKHIKTKCDYSGFYQMLNGNNLSSKGWILAENKGKFTVKRSKPFKLMNPDGIIFEAESIKTFCGIHKLDRAAINHVLLGNKKHYKGWIKVE